MILLKLIRLIICLSLTVVVWPIIFLVVFSFALALMADNPPWISPRDVYTWLKTGVTRMVIAPVEFLKRELR